MIKPEMALSNHTSPTVAETVESQTVDIDIDLLKKERTIELGGNDASSSQLPEKWANLNDRIKDEGGDTENSGSVASEPKRQFSRRNSNESCKSTYSAGSAGSSGSKSSAKRKAATKRRSWKKPKDKPKRPLSAYNIFFKHTRSRIVEGLTEEGTNEETIASIEGIVANSTETRRHRKTHGQISFGDLARTIAEKWKTIDKNQRALFDHYAALDMKRYRRDVSIWKAKKETEALAAASGNNHGSNSGNGRRLSSLEISASSACTAGSMNYMTDSQTTIGVGENYDDWNTPQHRALSTSFNSVDSEEDYGFEPLPLGDIQDSQNNMIGRSIPSYIESNPMNNGNNMGMNSNNGYNNNPNDNNSNNGNLQNKKLRDIWMKNRQLEESINKLKKELSQTNFSLGGNNGSSSNMNVNVHPDQSSNNQKFLPSNSYPVEGGPSIDRMQQLHRRRMLMGDILPPMGNGQMQQNNQGLNSNNSSDSRSKFVEQALMDDDMQMQLDPFDMNPVPFEEVFSGAGAEAKKRELITNLGHLDFFAGNGGGTC